MTQADMEELREAAVPLAKLRPDTGERAWQQITTLFDRHGFTHIPTQLRDELVTMLLWARYGEKALSTHDAYRARIEELEKALEHERTVANLAHELIFGGGLRNSGHGLMVVEKPDRSDPHWRLCMALEERQARTARKEENADG